MNKKGNVFSILSKKEIVIGALIILALAVIIPMYNSSKQSAFESNQKQVIEELKGNMNTVSGSIDGMRTSILLINQNVGDLEKTKANDASVKELTSQVQQLNTNLQSVNSRLENVENNIKVIEPNYVQNVDLKDMRTYVNIFNFRLVLNFFIALSISLFAFELVKFFGDFFSFGYMTKSYDIKSYMSYRKSKKHNEIKVYQQHIHKQDETNGKV